MEILHAIREAWFWTGLSPREVISENDFGSVIVSDEAGLYWRICPEELTCQIVARSGDELDQLRSSPAFSTAWSMQSLVAIARSQIGDLLPGQKYFLVTPSPLGGKYEGDNIRAAPFHEVLGVAGSIARQIHDLPDGAKIRVVVS